MQTLIEAQAIIARLATCIREYHNNTGGSSCDHASLDFQCCICGELELWHEIEATKGVLYGTKTNTETGGK